MSRKKVYVTSGEPDAPKAEIPFSVVVPCRELDEPRARAWEWVRRKLVEAFPNAEIVPSDDSGTGDTPFNRSRAIIDFPSFTDSKLRSVRGRFRAERSLAKLRRGSESQDRELARNFTC